MRIVQAFQRFLSRGQNNNPIDAAGAASAVAACLLSRQRETRRWCWRRWCGCPPNHARQRLPQGAGCGEAHKRPSVAVLRQTPACFPRVLPQLQTCTGTISSARGKWRLRATACHRVRLTRRIRRCNFWRWFSPGWFLGSVVWMCPSTPTPEIRRPAELQTSRGGRPDWIGDCGTAPIHSPATRHQAAVSCTTFLFRLAHHATNAHPMQQTCDL